MSLRHLANMMFEIVKVRSSNELGAKVETD